MRKYFGGLVAVLAIAALVPGTALATHSNGEGPDKDFRVGTHKGFCPTPFGTFPCQVHVNGQSESATGPGVPARGQWYIRLFAAGNPFGFPDVVSLSGSVACLTTINTSTWTRLAIEEANVSVVTPGFHTIIDRADDNGEGVNDPEDGATGFLAGPGTTCPPIPLSTTPIESGNITNHDGI
jgi:hypothetical protein